MRRDPAECYSGGCPRPATVTITFTDGWKGHYCRRCAEKIKAPTEATTRERALAERDVPQ